MEVKATLEEKVSKNGNPYTCIVVYLTDNYKKTVFLDQAEIELLKVQKINNNSSESDVFPL